MDNNSSTTSTASNENECFLTDEQIKQSYNLTLHIVSVFVLLIISFLGASFSVASTRVKFLRFLITFYHLRVVLATGFIHILPDAMETLTDPCLPDTWNVYGAYAGLFAMLAVLGMQLIEFLAHQRFRSTKHGHAHITTKDSINELTKQESEDNDATVESTDIKQIPNEIVESVSTEHKNDKIKKPRKKNHVHDKIENIKQTDNETEELEKVVHVEYIGKPKKKTETHDHNDESINMKKVPSKTEVSDIMNQNSTIVIEIPPIEANFSSTDHCESSGHCHGAIFQDDGEQNKISAYLLEFGIALHSVLIGLTLGTATESFVALFIALSFHQFFEAIALGAQIARSNRISIKSAIFMVIFFSFTTPVGIAIGIGIHSGTYNPKSVTSLLVTGTLDSLSAGILIYVALVNLITADMGPHALEFHSLSKRLKFLYFAALYLGVAAMAVIGRWA
ncbi:unnamed protein product [Rotaria sp. Silwood2]|nr:unnamed protein product [Rotaria sp. Silwood2]CAF4175573.1 unnamed protein product [Rotaria sp. Silwood2]CAF4214360.1 unnamed protein product [Rotaria sp. Silwood2]